MSTKGTRVPDRLKIPFAGITPAPTQEKGQDLFPTGNWRAIRPVYRDKLPPCNNACGTNEKIQGYLDLVKRGKYLDAYALIKEDMPFPSVTGRVCYHPCEQACNRGQYDEAISIRAVERFLGDLGQALIHDVVRPGAPNGKTVAVVGSGPAGHSAAYQLARLGYKVTILEKSPKAGGLNRGGIPDWVLPQHVLDREIERLVELGITIQTNVEVGKDVSWDDLQKNYDACVLAVGLTEPNSAQFSTSHIRNWQSPVVRSRRLATTVAGPFSRMAIPLTSVFSKGVPKAENLKFNSRAVFSSPLALRTGATKPRIKTARAATAKPAT